ncbi:MAG: GEVED domain-containing protein [Bacteroidales bacterium]|nr:GEVED domain-containing protein [Bacteroidales bacterium]
MKKGLLAVILGLFLSTITLFAQGPTLLTHVDFEQGIPAGWTVSSSSNAATTTAIASTGNQSLRMTPASSEVIITSPEFAITPGCATRLEFSHIPILENQKGGRVEVKKPNGTWQALGLNGSQTPNCYDPSYYPGQMVLFNASFFKTMYWTGNASVPLADLDQSYWKNEIFYLFSTLGGTATSVQIRFILPQTTGTAANFTGWFLDDIRLYVASTPGDEIRVPQLKGTLQYPSLEMFPTCSDIPLRLDVRDAQGAMSPNADAVVVEYLLGDETTPNQVTLAKDPTAQNIYEGAIPFNGFGSQVKWRIIMKDLKGNQLTYPFVYGHYNQFTAIRPYIGNEPLKTTGLSSQEMVFKTNAKAAAYQMRYSVEELLEAGYASGEIGGLSINLTQAVAGFAMPNFKLYVANLDPDHQLSNVYQYQANLVNVINEPIYINPAIGWHYLEFSEPFLWDGVSDILVKVCWGDAASVGGVTKVECVATSGENVTYKYEKTSDAPIEACSAMFPESGGTMNYKPNFKFNFVDNCNLPIDPGLSGSETALVSPSNCATTNSPLRVYLRNEGTNPLTEIVVSYSADDGTSGTATWTGNLPSGDSVAFTVTNNMNITPGYRYLEIITSVNEPNIDWNQDNDTARYEFVVSAGPMSGVYSIGTLSGVPADRQFANFNEAFRMLECSGVSGPTTIKIALPESELKEELVFPQNITGASTTNTITFTSATTTKKVLQPTTVNVANIDLSGCKFLVFDNIEFRAADSYENNARMVTASLTTSNITFNNCKFASRVNAETNQPDDITHLGSYPQRLGSVLNLSAASHVTIDSCLFSVPATKYIDIQGMSDVSMSDGIEITNSTFEIRNMNTSPTYANVTNNAINATLNKNLVVRNNKFTTIFPDNMNGISSNYYAIMLSSCKSFNINKNEFDLSGVSAMILSDIPNGTLSKVSNNKISVRNNNIVSYSPITLYGVNLVSGTNILLAYNNVYALGTDANAIGYNLGNQGTTTSNIQVKNNIIVSELSGYAVRTSPSTPQSIAYSNNLYYKIPGDNATYLFYYGSSTVDSPTIWQTYTNEINSYYTENPLFAAWNNLNTTSTFLCEKGVAVPGVTDDFFGRPRSNPPCIGALEFEPPTNNIYVMSVTPNNGTYNVMFDGVDSYSDCDFGQETITVRFKNISENTIPANSVTMNYKVDNSTVKTGTVSHTIEPNVEYEFSFTQTFDFSAPTQDMERELKAWSAFSLDTIKANDTTIAKVFSSHQIPARADMSISVPYGTTATLSVTSNDSVYWFYSINDEEPFLKSQSLQTTILYADTTLYFSEKSEVPNIKITEVQLSKTTSSAEGLTTPLPDWVTTANAFEITNLGNGAANMGGYKFKYIKANANQELGTSITKTFEFPADFVLPAGAVVTLLPKAQSSIDTDLALGIGTGTVAQTNKLGAFIENPQGTIVDAVALNGATFPNSIGVPSSVWTGASTDLNCTGKAGISRIITSGNNQSSWVVSSATNPMTIGVLNPTLLLANDNGCYGEKTVFNVNVTGIPEINPGISEVSVFGVEGESACTLTDVQVQVKIVNMGVQASTDPIPVTCELYENNALLTTITDSYTESIAPYDTVEFVLGPTLNLSANTAARNFTIKTYTTLSTDVLHSNDTSFTTITSLLTPLTPTANDASIDYATQTTLTATTQGSQNVLVWYEDLYTEEELARGSYTTPILYENDTFYVASIMELTTDIPVGTGTILNTTTAHPAPFAYTTKKAKEQYLYTVSELSAAGLTEGSIGSLAFNIDDVNANVTMGVYRVSIGTTNQNNITTWINGLEEVYSGSLSLTTSDSGWEVIQFTEPFQYDGQSNIVVQICFETTSTTGKVKVKQTETDYNSAISYRHASNNACEFTGAPTTVSQRRPNIQFNLNSYGCISPREEVIVTIAAPPAVDAGVVAIPSPVAGTNILAGIATPIEVELKNYGSQALTSAAIHWSVNGVEQPVYNWTGNLANNATSIVTVGNYTFVSGTIELVAWVVVQNDNENSNDTVTITLSSCLGNENGVTNVTIGPDATDDYATMNECLEVLKSSGICGPIEIEVKQGTYNEQLVISDIAGLSSENYIVIKGEGTADQTIFTYTPASNAEDDAKYVLSMDSVSNVTFQNLTFSITDTTTSFVVNIDNSENVTFNQVTFATPHSNTPNLFNIKNSDNLVFTDNNFYGSSKQINSEENVSNLNINNNRFYDFGTSALDLSSASNLQINNNSFSTDSSKIVLTAVKLSQISGNLDVMANRFFLTKGTEDRVAFELTNSNFTQGNPAVIANNSISVVGPSVSTNFETFGISLDNISHVDVFYNTVYMKASNNSAKSRALSIGETGSSVRIRNNNLDNQGKGYAIYVESADVVVLSNTNNFAVNGSKFAKWGADKATLALLQTASGMDNLSLSIENSFLNDSILSLRWPTDIVRAAEPLDDINVDIENNVRPISPKPTIGAYEYLFTSTDTGIPTILQPVEGDEYIEGEPLTIEVELKNFGNYTISSVDITAVLKYHQDSTDAIQQITETWTGMLASLETTTYTFQGTFTPPLNYDYEEELYMYVYTTLTDDTIQTNDTAYTTFLTIPSTDLEIDGVIVTTERCNLTNYAVQTKVKNVGEYQVNSNNTIELKYYFKERPDQIVTELLTFPYNDQTNGVNFNNLQPGASLTYSFNTTSNIYPTDLTDDTLHLVTIVKTVGDHQEDNDTLSTAKTVISKVSPPAPTVTHDYIPYGTWGHPSAEQANNLPIKWFSNQYATTPFYAPTSYNASRNYTTTQLFADTTFYLMVNASGAYPCASEFTPVTVYLDPRAEVDASVSAIVEPIPEGWVYMELGDTIKAMVWNYGTQPLSNFNISYSIKPTSPATAEEIIVTETCTESIAPLAWYVYSFNQLADMSNVSKTYKVRAWVDANNDYTALNDTCDYTLIKPKNGANIYTLSQTPGGEESLDITRVKLGAMESTSNASGNKYTNYTEEIPPAVLFKGVNDEIQVQVDNSSAMEAGSIVGGWIKTFLDWNRDGIFAEDECVMSDTIWSGQTAIKPLVVPSATLSGLTRMRVILAQGGNQTTITDGSSAPTRGEVEDYKILVRTAEQVNAELQVFVDPDQFLSTSQQNVSVQLKNAGLDALTSAAITWQINQEPEQVFNWNGNLATGASETVALGQVELPLGNSTLKAIVNVAGDNYHENDTITKVVHVFKKVVVPYATNFDEEEGNDDFFAYDVSTTNPTNCWEFGTPAASNSKINAPYSEPNCWKTKLEGNYPANNESYLYSPIYDIGVVKPDTMSFMMRTAFGAGASMHIEYLNWEGKWVMLGALDDPNATNWYNAEEGFTTTATWREVIYSLKSINHLFGNELQFRFVFKSATSRNDGVAIDDFEIKRAKRDQDAGITTINLEPNDLPNYGSNFYPRVGIKNYGAQVLDNVEVCYLAEGMYIPICESITNAGIEPDDTIHYTFTQGTYLAVGMPDPFNLCAFTRLNPTDVYTDNDSCCVSVVIGPLQKDVGIVAITAPGEQIVSNDNIEVAIHIKNYGLDPVSELPVGFSVSGGTTVTETVYFTPPLYNGDEYVYRFNERFRASFGAVNLKCWTGQEGDYYHDNDTLYKRLEGTSATRDLEAKYVTIDDANPTNMAVQLTFMNRSSVGIGDITVGYYVNGDVATAVEETYRLGNIVPSGTLAHHKFEVELPRANGPYYSITAYVSAENESDRENDTTSVLYMGYRDGVADTIFVEQTAAEDCKVQLIAHNAGTIGGTTQVKAHLVQNGDFANKITQTFTWEYDEPNPELVRYMNFEQRIPKSANGQYNLIAWIEYPYDADHRNDSTNIVVVKTYVGLEDQAAKPNFELEQNQPNPFDNQTSIGFTLPEAGNVELVITNNIGQIVYQKTGAFPQGRSEIKLEDLNLAEGTYYYTMYYNEEKQVKKMIVVK